MLPDGALQTIGGGTCQKERRSALQRKSWSTAPALSPTAHRFLRWKCCAKCSAALAMLYRFYTAVCTSACEEEDAVLAVCFDKLQTLLIVDYWTKRTRCVIRHANWDCFIADLANCPGTYFQHDIFPSAVHCLAAEHGHVLSLHVAAGALAIMMTCADGHASPHQQQSHSAGNECISTCALLIPSVMLHPVADVMLLFTMHHFAK